MLLFIVGLIFLAATISLLAFKRVARRTWAAYDAQKATHLGGSSGIRRPEEPEFARTGYGVAASLTGFIAAVLIALSLVVIVASTQVGVPVTLGHAGAPLESGIHFKSPITKVHKLPTRGVLVKLSTDDDATAKPVLARSAQGGLFTVSISTRWATDKKNANHLFLQAHTSQDSITKGIVETALKQATNAVYVEKTNSQAASQRGVIADEIGLHLAGLVARYGIDIDPPQLLDAEPDAGTRAALSSFAQEQQRTAVAGQAAVTAQNNAAARVNEAIGIRNAAAQAKLSGDELATACMQTWSNVVTSAANHGVAVYTNPCGNSAVPSVIAGGK